MSGPEDARDPVRRAPGTRPKACLHQSIVVDPAARTVTCAACGDVLDPYKALDGLADQIDRYEWSVQRARRELAGAEARLAAVERLERNAKARARNAVARLEPCACDLPPHRRLGWKVCPFCGGAVQ